MNKVALIIIYNHRYDKNIEILERIYSSRFSNIFHLIPFYDGNKPNVIPVYENALYFQGYIAQGFKSYFNEEFKHYFFIADDLILNPTINELNYQDQLKLNNEACYIPHFINLHEIKTFWPRVQEAYNYRIKIRNVEVVNELPTYQDALYKFAYFNLNFGPLKYSQIWKPKTSSIKGFIKMLAFEKYKLIQYAYSKLFNINYSITYPLVGSYSDICIVSSAAIKKFAHNCGAFAATNLHVEVALPTAMVLAADEIVTENNINFKGKALWPDGWNRLHGENDLARNDLKELDQYNFQLKNLLNHFPETYLYLHPIKLSKWNTQL